MSYIEDIQNRRNQVRNNIAKAFGCEFVKAQDDELGEIEKAVYADTAENRKLGRVGQEWHRGNGKKEENKKVSRNNSVPEKYAHTKNTKFIDWSDYNSSEHGGSVDDMKLSKEAYKMFPIGKQFKDSKGNVWTVDKHDKKYDIGKNSSTRYSTGVGAIRLRNEKKKVVRITPYDLLRGFTKNSTTGISELDKYMRQIAPRTLSAEERKRAENEAGKLPEEFRQNYRRNVGLDD